MEEKTIPDDLAKLAADVYGFKTTYQLMRRFLPPFAVCGAMKGWVAMKFTETMEALEAHPKAHLVLKGDKHEASLEGEPDSGPRIIVRT